MKPAHLAFILFIDCIWAFNIVAVKIAVEAMQPLTAVMLRYVIVALVCAPWIRWLPGRMPLVLATGVIAGAVFMGLGGVAFALADNVAALAIAGQVGVPLSLILAVIVYKERIRWPRITGIALAFAGVAMLLFDPRIFDERLALALTLAAALCWAIGNLLFRELKGINVLNLHGWLSVVSVPLLLGASLWWEPGELARATAQSPVFWAALAYSAIASSIVGHAGLTWLFQRYPVSTVAPMTLPTPLLSVAVGAVAFGIPLTWEMVAGGLVTLVGVAIITLRTADAPVAAGVTEGVAVIDLASPNFDARALPVVMAVLHYTGMPSAAAALDWLADPASRVSAHYVVAEDGQVVRMVDEASRAWHAGRSWWRGITDVNSASIGIEIVNPGHEFGYRPFPEPQMAAVEDLLAGIVARHRIEPAMVVGHSDIAPARKEDPGELFDWPRLARAGLALATPAADIDPGWNHAGTLAALHRFGYDVTDPAAALRAFQRRFRPTDLSGVADAETRAILLGLLR